MCVVGIGYAGLNQKKTNFFVLIVLDELFNVVVKLFIYS